MKKNTNLLEKKINTMEGNFFNLDTEINDNKKEIIQIKKERNEYKANLKSISVNDNHSINEKLNKLI
jgi:septal ring factor EnvC (AmiA/AmiB activator)